MVWHQYIGSSVEDINFGSVKLLYNNQDVTNLYSSTLIITNNSGKNVTNLELLITCDQTSLILVSHAKNRNGIKNLSFTESFSDSIEKHLDENRLYFHQRRDYFIPVINKGDTIDVTLLTTNTDGLQPTIFANTEHEGVKLIFHTEPDKLFGVPQTTSALIGIFVSIVLCLPIYLYIDSTLLLIILSLLNGWIAQLWGVIILKLNQQLIRWQNN